GATSLAVPEPDESRDLPGILFFPTCPFRSHFQSKTRFSCPFRSRLRGVGLRKSLINYRDDFGTRIRAHHSGQRNLPTRFLVSSVIRTITITALFHPARHWRRRHARRLGSDSLGRSRRRNRGRDFGARRIARRIFENAIEIADLHQLLLHHGRQGRGELIDFPRSDTP